MTGARDQFDGLRCPHAGCSHVIRAFTGLQELQKLIVHYRRKHKVALSMNAALTLRAGWESEMQA